jgi:hypothetical protein
MNTFASAAALWGLLIAFASHALAQDEPKKPEAETQPAKPNVFVLPRLAGGAQSMAIEVRRLFRQQDFAGAEKLLLAATEKDPTVAVNYYNLACAQARQAKTDAALASLAAAVDKGFRDADLLKTDDDLASLRESPKFQELAAQVAKLAAENPPEVAAPAPKLIDNGVARVDQDNTVWNPKLAAFQIAFRLADDDPRRTAEAVKAHGKAGELVRQWQQEGAAAGLIGILYDNQDRTHSQLPVAQFPQLTKIEYAPEANREGLDMGLQARLLFNLPTFGNSSTALTAGPFWRSQTRIAQVNARTMEMLYRQYTSNHLYFYPEHRDFDPGRNGKEAGFGDVYPANTPYVITSQGSSGSDQAFLHAVACTLAAFQPKTREKLVETNLLMPTVQMVFRRSNKQVASDEDYLTGKAHPPVFQGAEIDVERMVRLAHEIEPDAVPPMVQLLVAEEDEPRLGIDYFEASPAEKLFDTPAAIARVFRTTARERRMVLTAATSYDANGRDLAFRWTVLQGRPEDVQIKPLKPDGSLVELRVKWHTRFPVSAESKMETNRIDVGAFVHNGKYWSAPGIVSILCLDDEERTYNAAGRIESVVYRSQSQGGNYADPAIHTPRDWRDEYRHDDQGRLLGWTRIRGEAREEFTAGGHLVVEKDESGRPRKVKKVSYAARVARPGQAPLLEQIADPVEWGYEYAAPDDRIGRMADKPL